MRVACLSDVHANLAALEACIDHATERGADRFVVAGDLVGKGPRPAKVVARIQQLDAPTVSGNVDRRILRASPDANAGMPRWTVAQLSDGERSYLSELPRQLDLEIAGRDLLLVHGSPIADIDFVFPSITERALAARLKGHEIDALVCGHTHLPFHRRIGGVDVVNAGSAGLPFDGDPRPSYAMIDFREDRIDTRIHRFSYDVEATVQAVEETGAPGASVRQLRTGSLVGAAMDGSGSRPG